MHVHHMPIGPMEGGEDVQEHLSRILPGREVLNRTEGVPDGLCGRGHQGDGLSPCPVLHLPAPERNPPEAGLPPRLGFSVPAENDVGPAEKRDLAGELPEVVDRMQAAMDEWKAGVMAELKAAESNQ